jgi:hypothetical protein
MWRRLFTRRDGAGDSSGTRNVRQNDPNANASESASPGSASRAVAHPHGNRALQEQLTAELVRPSGAAVIDASNAGAPANASPPPAGDRAPVDRSAGRLPAPMAPVAREVAGIADGTAAPRPRGRGFGFQPHLALAKQSASHQRERIVDLAVSRFRRHMTLPAAERGVLSPLTNNFKSHATAFARLSAADRLDLFPFLEQQWRTRILDLLPLADQIALADALPPPLQKQTTLWKHAATVQKKYRERARQMSLAAQRDTPYPDQRTFYWATRSPQTLRERPLGSAALDVAFDVYNSTAPLEFFDEPLLLHSMQRRAARIAVMRRLGVENLPWSVYAPSLFGGHTMPKNNLWMLGGMHRTRDVVLAVAPDDETIVRGSAWSNPDDSLHNTDRSLSAYLREILAMSTHYSVVERPDGLQGMAPRASARYATLAELETPAGMPKETLRQTLLANGVNVTGISTPGGAPADLQAGIEPMDPAAAKQTFIQALDASSVLEEFVYALEERVASPISDGDRIVLAQQFKRLLASINLYLATLSVSLEPCAFGSDESRWKSKATNDIERCKQLVPLLDVIATRIYGRDTASEGPAKWIDTFIAGVLTRIRRLETKIAQKFPDTPTSSP